MNKHRILSGYDIVAKGATKVEATLPELGIKEVFPNKTWLENKQIQAAIAARRHLIQVERIDKSGVLNHAEWREELQLAEVTQNVGSYWQYLGHNVGKTLYLKPEEALFLLETGSLFLKYNDVKVSLQQAYSLLLRDRITLLQYKVYASLSRVGYRVYRHSTPKTNSKQNVNSQREENVIQTSRSKEVDTKTSDIASIEDNKQNIGIVVENPTKALTEDVSQIKRENEDSINKIKTLQEEYRQCSNHIKHKKVCRLIKLQKLKNRLLKPCNTEILHKYFDNLPDLLEKNFVSVKAPDKNLIPNQINLIQPVYNVNLNSIQNIERSARPTSTETNIYSISDEVNGSHIRRLRNTGNKAESNMTPLPTNTGLATQQNPQYRPSPYWRPNMPFNYYNFNMLFQRPVPPGWSQLDQFGPNVSFHPRSQPEFWRPNFCNNYRNLIRKSVRKDAKKQHLDGILKLAARLKQLMLNGNTQEENILSLQRLIQTYNIRYKTKVRLSATFEIVIDETILDTITLDDDDEGPSPKRHKPNPAFEKSLKNLKAFALKLKEIEYKDKSSGQYRRAFFKLLKIFNKSYKKDYYMSEDYELKRPDQIDLDSSESDLECYINDTPIVSGKKLKNPFNILKRLSETQNSPQTEVPPNSNTHLKAGTSKKYSEVTLKTFTKAWLPREDDFGRADIISNDPCSKVVTDIRREEILYDFMKIQTCKYDNWLDLKKSFFSGIQAAIAEFQDDLPTRAKMKIDSIVAPEASNVDSVFSRLNQIKSLQRVTEECNLALDFDVYNRDVQNFKKSNRPTPHFRIICLDESKNMPSGEEIAALHSKYSDQVAIVFAVVGIDSISYVQIYPTDLPDQIST
ncbi:jg13230 [Pararge aegeria aegeria]|uniref:Jg13230 protein n=3 Tax=Pararge aegeria TaxID=116150 RepID=A0A8S4RGT2_9NEOP|nr:jg13230 [Pararge aegeria aegeria]